jgi:hypothetical protein
MKHYVLILAAAAGLCGCTSVGNLGIIAKSRADIAAQIRSGRNFQDLGLAEGRACRHFVLSAVPWGNADIQLATDRALDKVGGDALINVTTINSLYGYIPIYNVYTFTCTTVKGTAIKFQ